jgi:hypothetical protein
MSRRQLVDAARLLRLPTDARRGGKRGVRDNQWLRSDILTHCYGPGLKCLYQGPEEADSACLNAARANVGELGNALQTAQHAIRHGMTALRKWSNETYCVPRDFDAEQKHLNEAARCFAAAAAAQDQHEGTVNEY